MGAHRFGFFPLLLDTFHALFNPSSSPAINTNLPSPLRNTFSFPTRLSLRNTNSNWLFCRSTAAAFRSLTKRKSVFFVASYRRVFFLISRSVATASSLAAKRSASLVWSSKLRSTARPTFAAARERPFFAEPSVTPRTPIVTRI